MFLLLLPLLSYNLQDERANREASAVLSHSNPLFCACAQRSAWGTMDNIAQMSADCGINVLCSYEGICAQ